MFRSLLTIALVVWLSPTLACAQETPSSEATAAGTTSPHAPAPASDVASSAPAALDPEATRVAPPRRPGLALTLAAGARVGIIERNHDPIGLVGPLGGLDLMIGHQLAMLDDSGGSIALIYHGSIFGGVDQPIRSPQPLIEHRHGLGVQMRLRSIVPALSTGAIVAHLPDLGAILPGYFLTAHIAFVAGPVYIGVPYSLDVYVGPAATLVAQSFGLSIGGTTM